MKATQTNLFDQLPSTSKKRELKRRLTHGGEKSIGKRKLARPFAKKKWIHLTLKSNVAVADRSFLHYSKWIESLLKAKSKKFGLETKDFVNMGNHLHIKIRAGTRLGFQNFLRSITSLIARKVSGARKGNAFGKFWNSLAYTRLLTTSFEVSALIRYFEANRIELSKGKLARERYLAEKRKWLQTPRLSL